MPAMQQQLSSASPAASTMPVALIILMWVVWVGVILVADFLAFMMFAFADSPGSARSAKIMIGPVFLWFGLTFVAGVLLLIFRGWWQVPLAFVLAISPPFLVFLGYNLLAGASNVTVTIPSGPPPPPPTPMNVPPGGFRPPASSTTQPDFQEVIRKANEAADEARRQAGQ